jgi:hypothetical protein
MSRRPRRNHTLAFRRRWGSGRRQERDDDGRSGAAGAQATPLHDQTLL